jgi:tetratricopeptide (TPR) repeat protein
MKVTGRDNIQVDAKSITATTLTDPESEYYLGDLLLHLNRLPDAEPHLTAANSKAPNLVGAQASMALLRIRQKKYDDALALLKKAVDADSKNPVVNFYYAYVLERADSDSSGALAAAPADRYATMRTFAKKTMELSPRFVEAYALLARVDLNAGENLDEAEATLKKALSVAPGRDDLQMLLAQTYLRTDHRDEARNVLSMIERNATNLDARRRATALLDQTEKVATFTDITAEVEKDAAKEDASRRPANPAPAPAPPVPSNRAARETVLESLTPVAPVVEGEMISGLLINLDCSNGLTLRIRSGQATTELHSSNPDKIQFFSYTADVSDNIKCGARNPGTPVTVTYRPNPGGGGEPLLVEFSEKK